MRTSVSAIAAIVAAVSFGGSAFAEGDYFNGVSKSQTRTQITEHTSNQVDTLQTGSIANIRLDNLQDGKTIFPHTSRDNR